MAQNYKDIYIRKNPLKEMKCNPLYVDNYKNVFEPFENSKNLKITNYVLENSELLQNDLNRDNYSYVNETDYKIIDNEDVKKISNKNDINNLKIKNNEIKNIDNIHNKKIINRLDFTKSSNMAKSIISNRLKKRINNKVVQHDKTSLLDDNFFKYPVNQDYKWKNSYFKNTKNGKWVYHNYNSDPNTLDYKTIVDFRDKRPVKINYDIIEGKN